MIQPLLTWILQSIDRAGIVYCVLRDAHRREELDGGGGEVDVLVLAQQLDHLAQLLAQHGFVRLPTWGQAPHHFFVYYDVPTDCWLKLDVISDIRFGRRLRVFRTSLAADCLAYRERIDGIYVASPEDELVTLLLHCLLDKGQFAADRCRRLGELMQCIRRPHHIASQIARYWPGLSWEWIASAVNRGDWDALLATRPIAAGALARHDSRIGVARLVRASALRKMARYVRLVRPYAPGIALLAPDGAGKSTTANQLRTHFFVPVDSVYMGLYSGRDGLQGRRRVRGLSGLGLLFLQWQRYLRARAHQSHNHAVIFDRYTYDALLPAVAASRLARTRRWILARACPAPDLVVVLDAPGELLFARKREHTARALERQRQAYLHLHTVLPSSVVIDATREPEQVRRTVTALLWNQFQKRLAHSRSH